jgi:hypothetical protein
MSKGNATSIELPGLCTFKVSGTSMFRVKERFNKRLNVLYEELENVNSKKEVDEKRKDTTTKFLLQTGTIIDSIDMKLKKLKDNETERAIARANK